MARPKGGDQQPQIAKHEFFHKHFLAVTTIEFTTDHSTYQPGPLVNNIAGPGKLAINPHDATALANAMPDAIPWMNAYQSIILHELGHAFYATRSNTAYSGDPAKRVEWCYEREGLASPAYYPPPPPPTGGVGGGGGGGGGGGSTKIPGGYWEPVPSNSDD